MNEMNSEVERQESSPLVEEKELVEKTAFSVQDIQRICGAEEATGYDVPFATLTWERWLEMQASMAQCFTRYQRAIEERQILLAALIVVEVQQIVIELQREASVWIGVTDSGARRRRGK